MVGADGVEVEVYVVVTAAARAVGQSADGFTDKLVGEGAVGLEEGVDGVTLEDRGVEGLCEHAQNDVVCALAFGQTSFFELPRRRLYEVLFAYTVSFSEMVLPHAPGTLPGHVSYVAVLIVLFPLFAPNTLGKSLVAALMAANLAMG